MPEKCGIFVMIPDPELCAGCNWATIKMSTDAFKSCCDACHKAGGLCEAHRKKIENMCAVKAAKTI